MKIKHTLIAAIALTSLSAQADDRSIGDGTLPEFLQQFDTNEDGTIDEEERQAIRDLRSKFREERRNSIDTDGDGQITSEEIEAARATLREKIEARRMEKFTEIAGEDGLISADEYITIPGLDRLPEFVFDAIFDRLDADGSGDISSEEFFNRLRKHGYTNLPKPPAEEEETSDLPEAPAEEETSDLPEAPAEEEETSDLPEAPAEEETSDLPEAPAEEETSDLPEAPAEEEEAPLT